MANRYKRKKHKKFNPIAVLIMAVALLSVLVARIFIKDNDSSSKSSSSSVSVVSEVSSAAAVSSTESKTAESKPQSQQIQSQSSRPESTEDKLDPSYSNLLVVNGEKPLPEDYNYGAELVTIPAKYKNGQLNQINKNVWPYMKAMLEAAWEDGVDLKVWSPYRSYETQDMLYQNQVNRCINKGLSRAEAELEAATVVARPGTSEHNTGLASDFNMASDAFENTKMYTWMKKNAADYGFIMRYSAEKQPITGVIHESWHWRFVGINAAKEINSLDMCLEEYVEYKNKG